MSACPTPDKMGFVTRGMAKAETKRITSRYSLKGQLRPYLCDCGYWHLTHLAGKDRQLDRRKRRANAAAREAA
jgi:hypothetical protein